MNKLESKLLELGYVSSGVVGDSFLATKFWHECELIIQGTNKKIDSHIFLYSDEIHTQEQLDNLQLAYNQLQKDLVVKGGFERMNKYQEALKRLRTNEYLTSREQREYYNLLQELVNKETPMKVVKWKLAQPETRCAKCGAGLERKHDYCWGCGRKVDWSDSE